MTELPYENDHDGRIHRLLEYVAVPPADLPMDHVDAWRMDQYYRFLSSEIVNLIVCGALPEIGA